MVIIRARKLMHSEFFLTPHTTLLYQICVKKWIQSISPSQDYLDKSIHILWPRGIKHVNILLFSISANLYMMKAGRGIKVIYSKMEHISCLAHGLHWVAKTFKNTTTTIILDQLLISKMKKNIFHLSCVRYFKKIVHNISLPPQPVLESWWG